MDRFLDILNSVKKKSNSTFSSCEPELIELMRKIDEMIDLKNKEWKSDTAILEEQLEKKYHENQVLVQESEHLRSLLSEEKNSHSYTLSQYEKDVKQLKDDMSRLKHKYVDLQKKIEHTKRKRLQETKPETCSRNSSTIKHVGSKETLNESAGKVAENHLNKKCADLEKENLILKLKMESVMIENSNLRCMLREYSEPFVKRKEKHSNKSSEMSTSDDNSESSTHIFDTSNILNQQSHKKSKHKSRSIENTSNPNQFLDNFGSQQQKQSFTTSSSLEYFEDDKSLEDKLNNVISQFETVSSSMIAM